MADCWSCGGERRDAVFCPLCKKIQPLGTTKNLFDAIGLERCAKVDPQAIERQFRERSKLLHPDRYRRLSAVERRLALEHTALLNDAYRRLKDPDGRLEYLMELEGVDVADQGSRSQDPTFLMEMMSLQEKIEGLSDREPLQAMASEAESRCDALRKWISNYFDERIGTQKEAVAALEELRYQKRVLSGIQQRLEEMV